MPGAGGRKAFAEGKKQPRIAFEPNLSCDQCPRKALFLGKETEPGFRVGRDMHIRLAGQAVLDVKRSILDRDRGLALFSSGEREMKSGVEALRLIRLEDVGHEVEQPDNRARLETVADWFHRLILEFLPCHRFGIRACHDVHWLGALLKRPYYFREVALLVLQVGADHVLTGRTNGHAVS